MSLSVPAPMASHSFITDIDIILEGTVPSFHLGPAPSSQGERDDPIDQKMQALEFFKDWTSCLLVTTVAAMGWVSAERVKLVSRLLKQLCIRAFALS
jgi:hypothetical protein